MLCESWLTHCTGSVCSVSSSSTAMPQKKITTLASASGIAAPGRDPAEEHDEPSERAFAEVLARRGRAVLADAEDRERQDDRAEADDGDADREQQTEVADHRHLGEAQGEEREDRVERHDEQRRARGCAPSPGSGVRQRSRTASSSTRACIWIA